MLCNVGHLQYQVVSCHGGRYSVGHGPPEILLRWATVHLAPPIIGLYVRSDGHQLLKK